MAQNSDQIDIICNYDEFTKKNFIFFLTSDQYRPLNIKKRKREKKRENKK